jgi:hypothetical protein
MRTTVIAHDTPTAIASTIKTTVRTVCGWVFEDNGVTSKTHSMHTVTKRVAAVLRAFNRSSPSRSKCTGHG